MKDSSQIVTGATPEAVAYALLIGIATKEGKVDYGAGFPVAKADAQWILDTYKRCLQAVTGTAKGKAPPVTAGHSLRR
jgi:hypothetical protein